MNLTYEMDIDAPVDQVFFLLDDDTQLKRWMEGLEEIIHPDGRDPENPVGTRFIQRIREGGRIGTYEGVVTAYEKPYHLAIRFGNKSFTMSVDYRLSELEGGGTHFAYAAEMVSGSWFTRLMSRLFSGLTRRILNQHMTNLKGLAEGAEAPSMEAA